MHRAVRRASVHRYVVGVEHGPAAGRRVSPCDHDYAALASAQGGLITRAQAIAAGYSERELRTLTGVHGPWVIVRRGVYAERELWESLTGYGEQAGLRDRAVHLTMRTDHLMSHDSAARALGHPAAAPAARAQPHHS